MDINKEFLRQYLYVVAVNLGIMSREVADALERYDKDTFLCILQARIDHLRAESESGTAFFSPEYYSSGIESAYEAIENIDMILAEAV